jgi:virginiamycin B lyase
MRVSTPSVVIAVALLGGGLLDSAQAQRRRQPAPVDLPEGAGRALVEASCAECHGLNRITNYWGDTEKGWRQLFDSMVNLPEEQADTVAAYLAAHFPVGPAPEAVVIPGNTNVSIREWLLPSLGSRPHDPLAADDGSVWWTGQWSTVLGRLDPTTGDVTQYPVTDDGARGPHTPIFDQDGTLWFTLQSGMVGRLLPETGEMTIVTTPSDDTYPYGIVVSSVGVPWYVDFRGNRLASVDPQTMEIQEHVLPSPDARPRRIAITPDDVLWYTDYARGYLGRFDPTTGEVREWPSPGGSESQPYGIAAIGSVVWYSESAVRPNTLVRFDTESESFQTWVIPSGGGVVRNMMATADGNLVLACSGVNRVALVEVGE